MNHKKINYVLGIITLLMTLVAVLSLYSFVNLRIKINSLEFQLDKYKSENLLKAVGKAEGQVVEVSDIQDKIDDNLIVSKKILKTELADYKIEQQCNGVIVSDKYSYCQGVNVFLLQDLKTKETIVLKKVEMTSVADAYTLGNVSFIKNKDDFKKSVLLISFKFLSFDNSALAFNNSPGLVVFLDSKVAKVLNNYPQGKPFWSFDLERAIFIPETCSQSGVCEESSLISYSLKTDKVTDNLTKEVGASEKGLMDVRGNKLPYWKTVQWRSNNRAIAELVDTNDIKKEIEIVFK